MNQDPQFLKFLLDRVSSLEEVRAYVAKTNDRIKQQGYSFLLWRKKVAVCLLDLLVSKI